MDYVKSLRSLVGTIPLILTAAVVIVLDEKNQMLLQLRADTNNWGIPGGYMELGEAPEEAAKREVLEETGLIVKDLQLLNVFSGRDLYLKYPNGDEVYGVNIVYITRHWEGELTLDEESFDLRFFPLSEIPTNIVAPHQYILKQILPVLQER
jgi:8-oxo-dGTP pyrophosphatase MutT (NUDIX family)